MVIPGNFRQIVNLFRFVHSALSFLLYRIISGFSLVYIFCSKMWFHSGIVVINVLPVLLNILQQ